jgi:micrococcal nuclease
MQRDIHTSTLTIATVLILISSATAGVGLAVATLDSTVASDSGTTYSVTIVSVTDGDTVDIRFQNGTVDTVRLLGIDTPETYGENTPDEYEGVPNNGAGAQCLRGVGLDAKARTQTLDGQQVTLKFDSESDNRGYYGRLLAYIYVDGTNYNYQLIKDGHARVYDSTFSQSERFYAAENDAQAAERGLWVCRNAGLSVTTIHEDAYGNDNDNLNNEYITITNTGPNSLDLSGWTVTDTAGHTYSFPEGKTIAPDESVTLHTGSGDNTEYDLYWGKSQAIWNNGGDTISVEGADGGIVVSRSY